MENFLIIKNIFNKLSLDNGTVVLGILSLLTGYFKEFAIIIYLIVMHEVGHCLFATFFKKNVYKITIYPFGGESITDANMNFDIKKELIILIMGPLFQFIFANLLILISHSIDQKGLIKNINNAILIFNLMPIYPLDGGKIINNILNINFNIKTSFKLSIIISYVIILLFFIYFRNSFSFTIVYMIIFLNYKIYKECREYKYNYNNFLLDRYLNKYHFKDNKIVENNKMFYRNKYNLVKKNNKYYTESDILTKTFCK